jgi:hypothetical protein
VIDGFPYSREIFAAGDTVISGITYRNMKEDGSFYDLEETNTKWINHIPDLSISHEWEFSNCYIRESNDASQLYILDTFQNKEYLISDLNLQKGDAFKIPEVYRDLIHIREDSVAVDSVYMKDGLKHVQLDYTFGTWFSGIEESNKLTFIEGIGPNIGLISMSNIGIYQLVNCFQNQSQFYKSELMYGHYLYELLPCPCGYMEWNAIQTISSNDDYVLQIEDNQIKIHFSTDKNSQVCIYDISGRLHYKRDSHSGEDVTVSTTPFPKGIYLLKVLSKNNNQINIHKIIL